MKILMLSDIHGNTEVLDKLDDEFKAADVVLFAGDFAECFKTETAKPVLDKLCKKHDSVLAVLGNCDEPEFIEDLEDADISCEKTLIFEGGLAFCGSGGGSKFTEKTPNERTEDDLNSDFNVILSEKLDNLILISHNPPKNTVCDAVNADLHAGSQMFADLIMAQKPLAVLCGHIHEGRGTDKIGDTVIVNPGSLGEKGTYAVMTVEKADGAWKVVNTELKNV